MTEKFADLSQRELTALKKAQEAKKEERVIQRAKAKETRDTNAKMARMARIDKRLLHSAYLSSFKRRRRTCGVVLLKLKGRCCESQNGMLQDTSLPIPSTICCSVVGCASAG
jgi:hypothetical protein